MRDLWLIAAIIAVMSIATVTINTTVDAMDQDTWIDEEYVQICEEVGQAYGISPELLIAIIETESSGQQYARNNSCCGLMQLNVAVHQERMSKLGINSVWNPRSNITLGADLLKELFEKYEDPMIALGAYNGQSNVVANVEAGNYSDYATKILNRAYELEELHGKHSCTGFETDVQKLTWRANDE